MFIAPSAAMPSREGKIRRQDARATIMHAKPFYRRLPTVLVMATYTVFNRTGMRTVAHAKSLPIICREGTI